MVPFVVELSDCGVYSSFVGDFFSGMGLRKPEFQAK